MKKVLFLSVAPILIFAFIIFAFNNKDYKKPSRAISDKTVCAPCGVYPAQAPATSDIHVSVSGGYINVSWSGGYGDHYTVGGYSGEYPPPNGQFQVNCIYSTSVSIPYYGTGNLRVTAFCGPCNNPYSSSVSGAVPIP
jgi:hypothetical protein